MLRLTHTVSLTFTVSLNKGEPGGCSQHDTLTMWWLNEWLLWSYTHLWNAVRFYCASICHPVGYSSVRSPATFTSCTREMRVRMQQGECVLAAPQHPSIMLWRVSTAGWLQKMCFRSGAAGFLGHFLLVNNHKQRARLVCQWCSWKQLFYTGIKGRMNSDHFIPVYI